VREDGTAAINALSIAEYTGIPRETVRRKVNELIQKGWVTRDDNGDLVPTPKAAQDLSQSTDATLDYLA
jgi:DNA-binding IclR family transcriptional regulator